MLPHIEFLFKRLETTELVQAEENSQMWIKRSNFTTQSIQKHTPFLMEMEGCKKYEERKKKLNYKVENIEKRHQLHNQKRVEKIVYVE